jgi:glutamate---cysteine ligase / carboxylate-amine ligase
VSAHDEHRFGAEPDFSLGVEEELFVVEPGSGRLLNRAPELAEQIAPGGGAQVKTELHACQLELITPVCETVGEAVGCLAAVRQRVLGQGLGVIGSGTHPTAQEGEAEITEKERYELISELLGDAIATPVAALHIHVGMPDPETAIRVFNGLRRHLPLLEALGANSPFRHGRDTGFASARRITIRGWPRSGAPRAMRDFEDFRESTARLTRAAGVPDYTFHWWRMRPHPRLGTVEVRALDAQAAPEHTGALVALVQCLARHEAQAEPVPGPEPEILEEASYRAARSGLNAALPDPDCNLRPVLDVLEETLELARPHAEELRCEAELAGILRLIEARGGAGIQRAAAEQGGMEGVLHTLLEVAPG